MIPSQLPALTEAGSRPLPTTARTRNGVEFNPSSDRWNYRDGAHSISLNFLDISEISPAMRHSLKGVLLWYAENLSPAFLNNGFSHFKRFFKGLFVQNGQVIEEINSTDLINFRANIGKNKEWFLGYIAGLALGLWGGVALDPLIQAVSRNPQSGSNIGDRMIALGDLLDGFNPEFFGVTL